MRAMGGSSELRLPTLAVPVDLSRAGRPGERVELFIADVPGRGRSQLVGDVAQLLESEPMFLPVAEPHAGGRVALVGKQAILWVGISLRDLGVAPVADGVPDEIEFEPSEIVMLFDHRHDCRVELDTGEAIDGYVLYSSPADRPRLADHLNLPGVFVRIWTSDHLYLVNKRHIVRVLEAS